MFMISKPIAQDSQMKHKPAYWANITFAIMPQLSIRVQLGNVQLLYAPLTKHMQYACVCTNNVINQENKVQQVNGYKLFIKRTAQK